MQLKGEKISFKYKKSDKYIIKDLDFEISSGEIVGLVAPSEKITIDGTECKKDGYNPVQLIFQHPEKDVNPKWKMRETISEAFEPKKELLDNMGIKDEWMNRWPSELSGGELQRFCVVRALSKDTKFLIADEMTTMLDAITQAQDLGILKAQINIY